MRLQILNKKKDFPKDFEHTVDVVLATFAVLVGVALERFLADNHLFHDAHPPLFYWCFAILISLSLRFLIGSDGQFRDTYVPERRKQLGLERETRSWLAAFFFRDLAFLVIFGVFLVQAADASSLEDFISQLINFLWASVVWDLLDGSGGFLIHDKDQRGKYWPYWLAIDGSQLAFTCAAKTFFLTHGMHQWVLVALAFVYIGFLMIDLFFMIQTQKTPSPETQVGVSSLP